MLKKMYLLLSFNKSFILMFNIMMMMSLFSNELKMSFFYFIMSIIILMMYLKIFYLNLIIFIFILIFISGIFSGMIYLMNFSMNYKNIFNLYPLLLLVMFIDLKLENINFLWIMKFNFFFFIIFFNMIFFILMLINYMNTKMNFRKF